MSSTAHATATASPKAFSARPIANALAREIQGRPAGSFEPLLQSWQSRFGAQAVNPLIQVAAGNGTLPLEDTDRYVALMGAAKLGGAGAAPLLTRFLKDKSWMIRGGALRALTALKDPSTADAVLPLLKDPALVVRLEAVEAVEKLQPTGAADALVGALGHGANYHGGKAQWVPQKALGALSALKAKDLAPRLKPLLDHSNDPELQKQTVAALESLTGRKLKPGAPLVERVREWKTALNTGIPTSDTRAN